MKKSGLGKGLDVLIPSVAKNAARARETKESEKDVRLGDGVQQVRISQIEPNRSQPRKNFDEDALLELAESIKQFGVIQPLIVQKKGDRYEIIAGERRWRAAKKAEIKTVPVVIKEYTPQEMMEISLIENIQREDLNPIEEAQAYRRLLEEYHLKQDEVAEKVSKSRTTVTNSLRLLKLDDRVQQMVIEEQISTGHARTLLGLQGKDQQYELACHIFDENLSVRETERRVKELQHPKIEKKKTAEDARALAYKDMEERIKAVLGTKVTVNHGANHRGKIQIEYYSDEDLERIVGFLEAQGRMVSG